MARMFESVSLADMKLKNRFVRSAVCEGTAGPDGEVTPGLTDTLVELAEGGTGLIITGHANVERRGWGGPGQLGLQEDRLIPGLKNLTDKVHEAGSRIIVQLAHQGVWAVPELSGMEPLGPSAVEKAPGSRAMTLEEIDETVRSFGAAAARAREAGFDGVQIHAGHGYLLSEFLSPFYNRRQDRYGGNLANRARIVLEVLRSIRKQAGSDFPVIIKINSDDYLEPGFHADEMLQVCSLLEEAGLDGIELTGGSSDPRASFSPARIGKKSPEAWYRDASAALKAQVSIPVILVGGIRSAVTAEALVEEGICDLVSLGRPLVRQPDLIRRWREDPGVKPSCVSCNRCFGPLNDGSGTRCLLEK